jgi:hypothetical protein
MAMTETAEFGVFCPGMLEVLSIGKGDLKLTIGGDNPEDTEKARKLIQEMLEKGYAIFVETDKGPTRVKRFNPHRMTYIISEVPDEPALEPAKTSKAPKKKAKETHVPVAGSRATAVGRTAGG